MKKQNKKNKRILIIFTVVFTIAAGIFCAKKIVSNSQKGEITTFKVRKETFENVIEIAGTVSSANSQKLKSLNDGTVIGVYKEEGDSVKKGDLIVQLDDSEQLYNLANLDYEISVAKQNQTKGKISLMEMQRASLVSKVRDRKIEATFDGIIASLDVKTGDYLEAKDSIGTLVDNSYLTADVEIAETDVANLKVGQKVIFDFLAYPEKVEGYLMSYPAIGEVTSRGATVVVAKVRIDNVPKEILPNFSFTGKIYITDPETKIVVEKYAIAHEKGETFVEILDKNGKITKKEVEVEPYTLEYVNVKSGLSGGEILKAQSSTEKSGRMRISNKGQKTNQNNKNNSQGGRPPMPPM